MRTCAYAFHALPTLWSPLTIGLALCVVLLICGWLLYAHALRVDRLHRHVLGARATVDAQLAHRAQAALDVARLDILDPASALLIARAAHDALDMDGVLVNDGLDPQCERVPGVDIAHARSRAAVESDLSRVLRTVLCESTRRDVEATQTGREALERLDRSSYRLSLARSFHNTHVAQARALRSRLCVRLFHLAGHAPMPESFDMDDDLTPEITMLGAED